MRHNWEYKTLGEVCKLSAGGDKPVETSKEKTLTNMIPVYSNGIENDGLYGYCSKAKVFNNALTISGRGTIGYPSIKREPFVPIIRLIVAEPNDNIKLDYLYYWVYNRRFSGNGAAIPQLTVPMIKNEIIPVPSMEMQKQIVAEFDKINEIISDCKEAIRNLDSLAKSLFYDYFGDPISNPKRWNIKYLGDICDVRDGTHDSPTYLESGIPLITSKNIKNGEIDFSSSNYISIEDAISINNRSNVENGDILMPMIGTIGNPIIVKKDKEFCIKNIALIKKCNNSPSFIYLNEFLKSKAFEEYINKNKKGATQKFLSLSIIRKLTIPVPPLALQERFAERIDQIEQQKKDLEETIANMQTLFNSRMDYWFN